MPQETVIIYNEIPEGIKLFLVPGDHSELNGVYINSVFEPEGSEKWSKIKLAERHKRDEELQQKLSDLVFAADGTYKLEELDAFPVGAVKDGAKVIIAGFYL